jgi:hypothetical protein
MNAGQRSSIHFTIPFLLLLFFHWPLFIVVWPVRRKERRKDQHWLIVKDKSLRESQCWYKKERKKHLARQENK